MAVTGAAACQNSMRDQVCPPSLDRMTPPPSEPAKTVGSRSYRGETVIACT